MVVSRCSLGDRLLLTACVLSYISGFLKLGLGTISLLGIDFLLLLILFLKLPIISNHIRGVRANVFFFFIALFVIAAVGGVFNSNVRDAFFALKGLRVSIFLFVYFFIGIAIGTRTDFVKSVGNVLVWLVGINICLAIAEWFFPYNALFYNLIKWEFGDKMAPAYTVRVCGGLVGPVQFALSCGFLFFYSMVRCIFDKVSYKTLFLLLFSFIGLLISKSRAVLFSVLAVAFFWVLFNKWVSVKLKLNFLIALGVGFIGLCVCLFFFVDEEVVTILFNRYLNAFDPDSVAGSSFKEGRITRWVESVLPAIAKMPLGGGTGFTQSFGEGAELAYSTKPILTESIYFDVFMELGWVVGGFFLLFVLYVCFLCFRKLHYSKDVISLVCGMTVLLFFVPGVTSPNMSAFPYTYLSVICLGILVVRGIRSGVEY